MTLQPNMATIKTKAWLVLFVAVLLLRHMVGAQTSAGITVVGAAKVSEAGRAGLQAGDIILEWHRNGSAEAEIRSPFDLYEIEMEQAPLGAVTIEGLRGAEKTLWVLGPGHWDVETRPALSDELLSIYKKARELEKKPSEAAKQWQTAGTLSASNNPWVEIWCLWQAVKALDTAEQWPEADATFQRVLEKAALLDSRITAQLMQERALGFKIRSDWSNAEKYYQGSLTELKKSGSENLQMAHSLGELGVIAWKQGKLDNAEYYIRQSLLMRQDLAPGSLPLARSFADLALVFSTQGNLSEAEDYYDKALNIQLKVGSDRFPAANTLSNRGIVAWQRGDLSQAEKLFRESLAIKEKLVPDSLNLAATVSNLGIIAKVHGDLSLAEHYQQRALRIVERLAPKSLNLAMILNSLGTTAFDRGDLVEAMKYHQRALLLEKKIAPDSLNTAASLNNLGRIVRRKGNLILAENYFEQALSIANKFAPRSPSTAETLTLLGEVARQHNKWSHSEIYYRQALSITSDLAVGSILHAESLAGLASVKRHKQRFNDAQQLYEEALTALEQQIAHFGGTTDFRADFRAKHAAIYNDYIELLLAQGQREHALEILERSRSQSLLELLESLHINPVEDIDPDLLKRDRSLREMISFKSSQQIRLLGRKQNEAQAAAAKKEVDDLLAQYHDIREEIVNANPTYAALVQPRSISIKQIQQLLDPDTLLLEYSLGEKHSHAWTVTSTSVSSHDLPGRRTIEHIVMAIYVELARQAYRMSPVEKTYGQASKLFQNSQKPERGALLRAALGRQLWQHLADAELEKKRWLIVADGALQYVPFNILPLPRTRGRISSGQGDALISFHEIVYLPSASVLAVLRRQAIDRKKGSKLVAVLADPVFDEHDPRVHTKRADQELSTSQNASKKTERFLAQAVSSEQLTRSITDIRRAGENQILLERLPFSRRESKAIVEAVPPGGAIEALDFDANRTFATNGNLAQYRIVHFATHALVNNEHPELSGLVFSLVDDRGKIQNGFLDLEDIYNLRLSADLVVLSACETALGKEVPGEGLLGLARGFMHAGATRVVASLWKVDDVATAELMEKLYQGIFHDHLSPAAALRRAQIQMMRQKRWAAPFYWAGFILEGEWKPLQQ